MIGRVALVSFERALGTICGGLMGYVLYVWADDITIVTNEVRYRAVTSSVGGQHWTIRAVRRVPPPPRVARRSRGAPGAGPGLGGCAVSWDPGGLP